MTSPRFSSWTWAALRFVATLLVASESYAAEPVASGTTGLESTVSWGAFVETNFPFFSSVLDTRELGDELPPDKLTPRGIILNLGNGCWACFDTDLLRVSA